MSSDASVPVDGKRWPFTKRAFVWGIGPSGARVAEVLAGLSIPVTLFQPGTEGGDPAAAEAQGLVRRIRGEGILGLDGHFGQFRIRVRRDKGAVTVCEAGLVIICQENGPAAQRAVRLSLPEAYTLSIEELETLACSGKGEEEPNAIGVWLDPVEGWPDRALAERALRALLQRNSEEGPACCVLFRHVPLWGLGGQSLYDALRGKGVRFLRLGAQSPDLRADAGKIDIELRDPTLADRPLSLQLDRLLVVGQPSAPAEASRIAQCVGDPLDPEGFLQKDNVHLYPSRSFRKGVYYVGSCKGEQAPEELAEEVAALLPEFFLPVATGELRAPERIRIDRGRCVSCLTCYRVCPHRALDISQGPVPVPLDPACYGCGLCAALCPGNAIELLERPRGEILAELDPVRSGQSGLPQTVLFCCRRLGIGPSGDGAGLSGALHARTVEVPCACSISEEMLLAAFLRGAERVLVFGCHPDNCLSQKGSTAGERRVQRVARYLEASGQGPGDRVRFIAAAPNEAQHRSILLRRVGPKGEVA
jgi:coenzyme F420-reducing hydrogenase delta subunit/Pyruvate/2-oxoacid:ferredoxin oxidoreductase delta subunit